MNSILPQAPLYGRVLHLELTPPGSQGTLTYGNLKPTDAPLRVGFAIERTLESKADKAKLSITNLRPSNRDSLVKDSRVVLSAGYRNLYGILFSGFADKVKTSQQGPDIVTELECSDGGFSITYAVANRTYAGPVKLAQVLQDLAEDLNVEIDGEVINTAPGVIKGIPDITFARGHTLDGPVSKWFDRLLKPRNIDWSIQNGRLYIVPRAVPTSIQPCVVLSAQSGMIETPAFSEKGLTVASVLNSTILPGRLLQVISKNAQASGFFKANACKYNGDTHDQAWRVDAECEAVQGNIQTTPLATPTDFARATV